MRVSMDAQLEIVRLKAEVANLKRQLAESPRPRWAPAVLGLTPSEDKILRILCERVGKMMTGYEILTLGWKRPLPKGNLIAVHVSLMRRKLSGHRIEIHSLREEGYMIDEENVARLDALRAAVS